jgi:hypothetical protein
MGRAIQNGSETNSHGLERTKSLARHVATVDFEESRTTTDLRGLARDALVECAAPGQWQSGPVQ